MEKQLSDWRQGNVFIIAEAGVNHNGSLELARKLVDAAVEVGADAVKFQTFCADKLVLPFAEKASYQLKNTEVTESQYAMLKRLELDRHAHEELIAHCRDCGIRFLSTPFDTDSIRLLDKLGLGLFKIPSGEITNLPYLRQVGALQKKVILSTGMADLTEVGDALAILGSSGTPAENVVVLHCHTEYPTSMQDVNLLAMQSMADEFGVEVGYSDHTLGIEVPIAAVALGAVVVEKHFTLNKTLPGPDHKASLQPDEFKEMVVAVRNIKKALGNGVKRPRPAELKNREVIRKSIVAADTIECGEFFTETNLTVMRPGHGVSPMRWNTLIGNPAGRTYRRGEMIDPLTEKIV